MKPFAFLLISYLTACSFALAQSQNLTGNWTGKLRQGNQPDWFITLEVNIRQVGSNLTGQLKTSTKSGMNKDGFVVEKFRGSFIDGKVIINAYEVTEEYSPVEFQYGILFCEGLIETNSSENKRTIEGTWICDKVYNNRTLKYINFDCSPGGTFIISQSQPVKYQEKSPVVESIISGKVIDKQTRKPVKTTLSIIGDKSPQQEIITGNDGAYKFNAPINDISDISITEDGYEPLRESLNIDRSALTKNFFLITKPVVTQPISESIAEPKLNEPIVLKNVLFNESLATLLPQSFPELDKLVSLMQSKSTMIIRLEGHTDKIGDADKNLKLSQDRVRTVKRYLIKKGISETRIDTKGYGDTKPICTPPEKGKPCEANRRVEFVVTEQ